MSSEEATKKAEEEDVEEEVVEMHQHDSAEDVEVAVETDEAEAEAEAPPSRSKAKSEATLSHLRQAKLQGVTVISEFESRRRGYFAPQIQSNQAHWHAFVATLTRSQVENDRILEFFNKRLAIEAKYAEALSELPTADLGKGHGGWRKTDKSRPRARVPVPSMEELVTSTEGLGAKVKQFVDNTRTGLLDEKLKALVGAFKETSNEVHSEGSVALENVVRAEMAVQAAYQAYTKAVEPLSAPTAPAAAGSEGVAPDLWLADMNYRIAVDLEKSIWNESQEKLAELFGKMKQLELGRRQTLHALVLRFVQAQGELWAQLPHIATGTALRISDLKTDPQQVESELSDEIKLGARAIEEENQRARPSSSASPPPGSPPNRKGGADTPPPPPSTEPFKAALQSPLEIDLVRRAEVIERRVTVGVESMPLMKKWRAALAVVTLDNNMHLFDLPADVGAAGADMTAAEAFKAIVPRPIDAKGRFKKGHAERLLPSVSLCLDFSKAKHRAEDGTEAFEVSQKIENQGFVKVFKSHEVKRVVLKAKSQEQMVDWCCRVNGQTCA